MSDRIYLIATVITGFFALAAAGMSVWGVIISNDNQKKISIIEASVSSEAVRRRLLIEVQNELDRSSNRMICYIAEITHDVDCEEEEMKEVVIDGKILHLSLNLERSNFETRLRYLLPASVYEEVEKATSNMQETASRPEAYSDYSKWTIEIKRIVNIEIRETFSTPNL